ncbi:hypothetical protein SAMN04487911_11648 [Arenibacter nanhaiticus]|uniref:GAF domain-containing protein n=1 Tax=Arenibacter nanhaiticus TaxID=558155 RepID=A0A1M6I5M1_9FLAO|nr:GAF domain-containing protein [Arenibacter nanhaiticus]SHJ29766.1 hypothetical protein SAMN04487911_11648 [Arenibacter nanhaiticus]
MDKILPLEYHISFNKLLERYDEMAKSDVEFIAAKAKHILKAQEPFPELREGFSDVSLLEKHKDLISLILQDIFSDLLGENEIKTASLPYSNIIFNRSHRFKKILENAGPNFVPVIRNQGEEVSYIMSCVVILNVYYGFKLDFRRPFFYDIPDANGIMRHYRILYNADFIEITPNGDPLKISEEDVDELLENIDDVSLWKKKIPPNSFKCKGFIISNMFDVTAEHSISEIKSKLIVNTKTGEANFIEEIEGTFKSLFGLPDIQIGFVVYNPSENQFEKSYIKGVKSFLLNGKDIETCNEALCMSSYKKLLYKNANFIISDVDKYNDISGGQTPYKSLYEQNIKSAIFAPITKDGALLGVLELVSGQKNALNSVNAEKLQDVMQYIVSAVLRDVEEEENLIDAVIQNECTSVHPAVRWKFHDEAKRFIKEEALGNNPSFKEIVFKEVHPLYGQIDIKDSSESRNLAIQRDLTIQLSEIHKVLTAAWVLNKLPVYEELIFQVNNYLEEIKESLYTSSEQTIYDFINTEIHPVLEHLEDASPALEQLIVQYRANIDPNTATYYDHRRNYDESVSQINKKLAHVLDKHQDQAQNMFPHYFERYKTDGIEHNLFIGDSMVTDREYHTMHLNNLRLWQLQVMCEMENTFYQLKPKLPVQLDVASLLLVYNTSLSIRFRMDEKRFDVDGTYNARYEVIKKRIDKSFIKGTNERLTVPGKLSIVYSQKQEEVEYLRYIKFLKSKGYFGDQIELLELEGLQGVSGLKAIRVEILYGKKGNTSKTYDYADLMEV